MNKKAGVSKLGISLGMTCAVAAMFMLLTPTRPYSVLELKALDLRFALSGARAVTAPVVHIDIDDESLARLGRWPWPRSYHAALVDILKECGAQRVLFDVLFSEKTDDNPQDDVEFSAAISRSGMTYVPFYFEEKPEEVSPRVAEVLRKDIHTGPDEAAALLDADPVSLRDIMPRAKRLVITGVTASLLDADPQVSLDDLLDRIEDTAGWRLFPEEENLIEEYYARDRVVRFFKQRFSAAVDAQGWPFRKSYDDMSVAILPFLESARGSGFINADADIDGVTRRIPLFIRCKDKIFPQLTVAALLDILDVQGILARPGEVVFKQALVSGTRRDIRIPVDETGCMLVNWQGRWGERFDHLPYFRVMNLKSILSSGDSPAGASEAAYLEKSREALRRKFIGMVRGRVCIVGLTATGTHDLRPVPLQANYPMVGTHSNVINTILTQRFIVRKEGAVRVCIFLLCALIIGLGSLIKMSRSLLLALCLAFGYFLAAVWVFNRFGIWVDLVGPLGIIIFGFSAVTSFRFFTEEKEKLWIKQAFSHYLSKEVINELMNDPSKLKLGGERRAITVFFSDVRGFTTFSESHQPEEVVGMLNEILTEQVKVVFKHGGTLDKFVGDELMAFFGAPGNAHLNDHAIAAVRTAIEIRERMNALLESWKQRGKEALHIGIGINSGDMVVGNMGSAERMDYTVIGDNVNLAARLCSAAGGGDIIISAATYEQVKETVAAEALEPIMVKGKSNPIVIYRVTGLK